MPEEAIFTDGGHSDRERWEAENEAAVRKATASRKRFRKQKPATKRELTESKSRAHAVSSMVERLKKTGLQGLKHRPDM